MSPWSIIPCGNGLEGFVVKNFPRDIVPILHFWYAADHLTELAKLLEPHDEAAASVSAAVVPPDEARGRGDDHRGVRALAVAAAPAGAQGGARGVLRYFRDDVHRMDYPIYVAHGGLIGSGAVESGCKTVVCRRLKLARMRRPDGTDEMCHLRALLKSEPSQWAAFERRHYNRPPSLN